MSASREGAAFARNAASSYGQRVLLGLSALLLTPYLFRGLGTSGFGSWSVMFTLTTIFLMLELGFSQSVTKYVAEHRAAGRRDELDATVGSGVVAMGALGLLALAASAALALGASGLAAGDDRDAFRTGMLVLGGAMFLRFPLAAYGAALAGYQRYDRYNAGQALTVVAFALAAVAAVEAGGGVLGVAVAHAGSLLVGALLFPLLLHRTDPRLRLRPRMDSGATRRRIASFGSFSLLADSMIFLGSRMDTVLIAGLRSATAAAPFAAAVKLQSGLQALTLPFVNLMMPMISDLRARGLDEEVKRRFILATRLTLQITLPVAIGVALFAEDIVGVWLGADAPAVTATIIAILAIQTLMLCAVPADKLLLGIGRVRTVGGLNMAEGLFNLTVTIFLVIAYGAVGAAIGTLLASMLIGPSKFPLACRAIGIRTAHLLRRAILPAIAGALPGVALMVVAWLALEPSGWRFAGGLSSGIAVSLAIAAVQSGPGRIDSIRRALRRGEEPATGEVDGAGLPRPVS